MSDDDVDDDDALAEAEPASLSPPRENPDLVGHEAAEAVLLRSYNSGRLPHAWLVTGPPGVGKATLAFRFARFLLAQSPDGGLFAAPPDSLALPDTHPVFRRVASGGHADLMVVERAWDPKKNRRRGEIVAEHTRKISAFLRLTPAEGGWRVVIVDVADWMNTTAANAILKILEEPPRRVVLLLLSENPGRLLATIRSRCRILALKPLSVDQVAAALARFRPDLDAEARQALAALSGGGIGRALALAADDGLALYRQLVVLLERLPDVDAGALNAFADKVGRFGAEASFALAAELLSGWLARMVTLAGSGGAAAIAGEASAMRRLAGRRGLDQWVEVWENLNHLFAQADGLNLDRKQVVLSAFFTLEAAARQAALETP